MLKKSTEWLSASANRLDAKETQQFQASLGSKIDRKTRERQKKLFENARNISI